MTLPRKHLIEAGQRFGRGTVIDPDVRIAGRSRSYCGARLRCDCGTEYEASIGNLTDRRPERATKSCGCSRRETTSVIMRERIQPLAAQARTTHGLSGHVLYHAWYDMLHRCESQQNKHFADYGARGITVCERWHDVRLFVEDIERDLGPRPDGMSLDRIDNDGNYEPGNVRWATSKEQVANRRPQHKKLAGRRHQAA